VKQLKESAKTPRELQSKDKKKGAQALELSDQPEAYLSKILKDDSTMNLSDHAQLSEKKSQGSIWLTKKFPLSVKVRKLF